MELGGLVVVLLGHRRRGQGQIGGLEGQRVLQGLVQALGDVPLGAWLK